MSNETSPWVAQEGQKAYITSHRDLKVYQRAFDLAMRIQDLAETLPYRERRRLEDQAIRSSRSVCSNISEAWRKRRYEAAFVSKLSDAETEAAETQTWLEVAEARKYVPGETAWPLWDEYEALLGSIVGMINHAKEWTGVGKRSPTHPFKPSPSHKEKP